MDSKNSEVHQIQKSILIIRGQKVMIDKDLADLYGVETKRLNEQVKRNSERFPADFMFRLNDDEKKWVVANCDHLQILKFSKTNPYVFTEHGAVMLASVLKSNTAVITSILVVRAFVGLRELVMSNKQLADKLERLENKYDRQFNLVFSALKRFIDQPKTERAPIGFTVKKKT